MRIQILGEKDLIEAFSKKAEASGQKVMPADSRIDRSELAFGLSEIASVVTIAAFAVQLAQWFYSIAQSMKADEEKLIRLKSSYGVIAITLRKEISMEELRSLLSQLEAPKT